MKIAILYMCTGNYTLFWNAFYNSAEKFFLPEVEKHYFVFTDGTISHHDKATVHRIEQENLGWPNNTLMRYHVFLKIEQQLKNFDFCYFFNANAEFCAPVGKEFLPEIDRMLFVQHPGFYNKRADNFSYDRNPKSHAYIPYGEGNAYVCGGVNGATSQVYIQFMKEIRRATNVDTINNVIALWHDESHSNKYALTHPHTMHSPSYCYPETWALPFTPKIRIHAKEFYGGHAYLRGKSTSPQFTTPPSITTALEGGLGNQMFQYAAGRSLAFRLNTKLILNTFWYEQERPKKDTPRAYSLGIFPQLTGQVQIDKESGIIHRKRMLPRWKKAFLKLLPFLNNNQATDDVATPDLSSFQKLTAPKELSGYWQNEVYFKDIAFLIREDFAFPPLPSSSQVMASKIENSKESVSVHIRRGDYAYNSHILAMHGLCSADYYKKALEYIKARVSNVELFIFSDEPEWVREHFETYGLPATVIDLHKEEDAHHDMHLMTLCKHHIIANSSFSWWGAWLGEDGLVIAPKKWYQDENYEHRSPVPSRWITF